MPNYFFPQVTKTLAGDNVDPNVQSQHEDNNFNATAAITEDVDPENPVWKDMKNEDLLIASPLVYGFSLADKLWSKLVSLPPVNLRIDHLCSGIFCGRRSNVYLER